ncbi:hypothetical protein [Brevundimonas naejangsanensis]|uniref:hypothetical protein n=1 Tax=Brevundimonas naejangsanensis TaxID=588932 RepID=UPI0026F0220B|nr:hypothetical protein [Brevundimonas naejangsanensis]
MTRPSLLACLILSGLLTACQPRPEPEPPTQMPAQTPAPASTREPEARLPEGPDMAPQPLQLDERPCRETLGEAASARLVQRCIAVSPATRPPCNAANPCDMIQGEIDRSCAMWSRDGEPPPKECAN